MTESNRFRAMTCKQCGFKGYAKHGSKTSKTGICPDCRGNDE